MHNYKVGSKVIINFNGIDFPGEVMQLKGSKDSHQLMVIYCTINGKGKVFKEMTDSKNVNLCE